MTYTRLVLVFVHTVHTYVCYKAVRSYLNCLYICIICIRTYLHTHTYVGEHQYKSRLEDIRILKIEVKKLRREKNILSRSVANIEDLRYVHMYCELSLTPENCYVHVHISNVVLHMYVHTK